ncbi:hypothetical protein [Paenisporosarcina sp. TG20]|uniref:DUF6904 family protein n=1 Tax=Paenisporosarcina sp. TG20 TaxID=1211706 RepID=UPI0002F0A81F|nr:hypothetical protein [Paenisporosarcina sp. TG20]
MLSVTHTENFTGARISGDFWDLDEVNQAIYIVVGDENKYYNWEGSRKRILGISYEIRHASLADRHVDFVGNGLSKESIKQHQNVTSQKNIYYSFDYLWPELIFTVIALNDFIRLYSKDHLFPSLDVHVTTIRKFQSVVGEALHSVMTTEEYDRFMSVLSGNETNVQEYAIQFVDLLNLNYINLTKEQREKSLGMIALKLAVQDKDYQEVRDQIIKSANTTKSDIHKMLMTKEYPEIKW